MEQRDTPEQFGEDPAGICRRWLTELDFAAKREKDWIKLGQKCIDLYRGKGRKKNSFNILYSNTETIASTVYNAPPKPDVRRRFKDAEPVGKVVSKVLERALEFSIDNDAFAQALTYDVLDMLLPGRGLSRVRYIPSLVTLPNGEEDESAESVADEAGESEALEAVAWEQVALEHVQWDDFRMGPGKTWQQVMWVAFRHRMTSDELVDKFGEEIGSAIPLDDTEEDEKKSPEMVEVFKTAEVWEIWDKDERKVRFVSAGYKRSCCLTVDDPMNLVGFYPIPRPLYAVCDATTLEPMPLYEQYREQAQELDRISTRINKLIDALRVRGIYDATMAELSELLRGEDNDLIPAQNVSAWIERGGLEQAVWMMPIEGPAKVLAVLYQQREASKQVIYEITGIADVMRGASDANETLGAQQLKAKWGGQRISRLQAEVQRYARDQIRIMAEIIGEKFGPDTLMKMTGVKLPTNQDVQMLQMQAQQAQAMGQQVPPFQPPEATVEQVMEVLRDDLQRSFRIDVETDSMVAAAQQAEAEEIQALVAGLSQMFTGLGPAVESGALPVESAKELMLAITRRAKMGSAVEDALDKMQAPKPQDDGGAQQAKAQADAQIQQAKLQSDAQHAQMKAQMDAQLEQTRIQADAAAEQARMQADMQIEQARAMYEQQRHADKLEADMRMAEMKAQSDATLKLILAKLEAQTRIEVAEIGAQTTLNAAQISAAKAGE